MPRGNIQEHPQQINLLWMLTVLRALALMAGFFMRILVNPSPAEDPDAKVGCGIFRE